MTIAPIPGVSLRSARTGASTKANELGMRVMQERAYEKRGEQYLIIKSPPASGKSRALMFIALDKLRNQGLRKAIIVVPERAIGGSFADEPLSRFGFWADWAVKPLWNLCNTPGIDEAPIAKSKVKAVGEFLRGEDQALVCTHATFRFAVDELGVEAFDNCLIAVDEFHHVSADQANKLGAHLAAFIARDKAHIVAMTGSYFRGDAVPVLSPDDESKFETVTYTYYEQLNGYEHLKSLDIGYYFYSGRYLDAIMKVLDPARKTIVHIPNVNSRESTKDKVKEANEIMDALGDWQGEDPATGFHLIKRPDGKLLRVADLVEDDPAKRDKVVSALKDPEQRNNRDHVDVILALGMAKEGFRLDMVRTRSDRRLPRKPHRNRADHRPRNARRARQDQRPIHQSDRRAGRFRGCGGRRSERHAQGDRCQPPDGAGACAAFYVHTEKCRAAGRIRLWRRRL